MQNTKNPTSVWKIMATTLLLAGFSALGFEGGSLYGRHEQLNSDKNEALHAHAGYYGQMSGKFAFGIPPVEMTEPSLVETTKDIQRFALPEHPHPVRKPQH